MVTVFHRGVGGQQKSQGQYGSHRQSRQQPFGGPTGQGEQAGEDAEQHQDIQGQAGGAEAVGVLNKAGQNACQRKLCAHPIPGGGRGKNGHQPGQYQRKAGQSPPVPPVPGQAAVQDVEQGKTQRHGACLLGGGPGQKRKTQGGGSAGPPRNPDQADQKQSDDCQRQDVVGHVHHAQKPALHHPEIDPQQGGEVGGQRPKHLRPGGAAIHLIVQEQKQCRRQRARGAQGERPGAQSQYALGRHVHQYPAIAGEEVFPVAGQKAGQPVPPKRGVVVIVGGEGGHRLKQKQSCSPNHNRSPQPQAGEPVCPRCAPVKQCAHAWRLAINCRATRGVRPAWRISQVMAWA